MPSQVGKLQTDLVMVPRLQWPWMPWQDHIGGCRWRHWLRLDPPSCWAEANGSHPRPNRWVTWVTAREEGTVKLNMCVCVNVRLVVGNMFVTFLFFHSVGNFIIPIDELRFFGGVAIPPTRCRYQHPRSRSPCCSCAVNWRRRGVGAARRRRSCLVQGRVWSVHGLYVLYPIIVVGIIVSKHGYTY